jgi:hypothetical protein
VKHPTERWIKVYTKDTPGWLMLTWQARGLMLQLARKVDTEGNLPLGKHGLRGLALILSVPLSEVRQYIQELQAEGRIELPEDEANLFIPGHKERQDAVTTGAARTARWRARHGDVTETSRGDYKIRSDQIRVDIKTRGTRVPNSSASESDVAGWASLHGIPTTDPEFAHFLDYWRAATDRTGRKADWAATWRNWKRAAVGYNRAPTPQWKKPEPDNSKHPSRQIYVPPPPGPPPTPETMAAVAAIFAQPRSN